MSNIGVRPRGNQLVVRADDHFEREQLAKGVVGPESEEGARPDEDEPQRGNAGANRERVAKDKQSGSRHGGCRGAKSVYDVC